MSGGGGGGGGGSSRDDYPSPVKPEPKSGSGDMGGSSRGSGSNPCDIHEVTFVNSPVASVIATLSIGSILDVALIQTPRRVVVKDAGGNIAGSITAPFLAQMLLCIDAGYEYEAEVLRIVGGVCKIQVRIK